MKAQNTDALPALRRPASRRGRRTASFAPLLAASALATACLTPPPHGAKGADDEAAADTSGLSKNPPVPSEPYQWQSVAIWGGGFVTGLAYSPVAEGILYARTDVGGAYRHDPKTQSWVPLTDFIGLDDANYLGIESVAVDPVQADRVYLAVGMYTADWAGTGAFMRSDDRGDTWKVMPVDFKMGGNDLSRSNGERLAIDPHQPKLLYFGSRRNGLYKSEDEAKTWHRVESFPTQGDREKGLGLPFVVFDPTSGEQGSATPGVYVGSQTDGHIYQSTDAGETWRSIHEPPEDGFLPRRAVFDSDGTLYVTYALGDSPYALKDGAVYRFEPKKSQWTDITPVNPSKTDTFGYGGIDVDPSHPGTLLTTTVDRWTEGAEIFRSRDRGKTWKPLMATAQLDGGGAQHVYHHREKLGAPQWLGDIKINPFDPNEAMIVEGGGVWATDNLEATDSGKASQWSFYSKNLEEVVARTLVSPPEGPPLLSAMLDVCGFRHDDLDASPERGVFTDPACASASSLDYAESKPGVVVRVGAYPWDGPKLPRGALSLDSGATWKQFGSEPKGSGGMGGVAVSADGRVLLWAPRETGVAYSKDGGKTWQPSAGLPEPATSPDWAPWNVRLASDRVNPKKFYAYVALKGAVYVSEDGGATFEERASVQSVPEYELQYSSIKAVPDHEGDVWITTKGSLLRSTDSGEDFDTVDSVDQGHGVGFGRPASGQSFPAVYVAGVVGGATGFFRSDDEGESFVRINDDAHQYGGATVITGDPRVYGRVYVAPGGRGIIYGEPKQP